MIRALFRMLSMVALAVAVITAVLDATRSIAAETIVLTSLENSWAGVLPAMLDAFEASVKGNLPEFFWNGIVEPVLQVPAFAVFAGLALILNLAGRKPSRRAGRFVLEN